MAFNPVQLLTSDVSLRQSWMRLQRRIADVVASESGWQNILFVGKDGNDATAQPNSMNSKYLTIQAAVDAWSPGYIILVGPGTYQETVTLPSAFTGLIIAAVTPLTASIQPPAGQPGIVYQNAQPSSLCVIHGLNVLVNSLSAPAVSLDASASTVALTDVIFVECNILNAGGGLAIMAIAANSIVFERCDVDGKVKFDNVGKYEFNRSNSRGGFADSYDITGPLPGVFDRQSTAAQIRESTLEDAKFEMQARVDAVRSKFSGQVRAELRDYPSGAEGKFSPEYCEFSAGITFDCRFANAGIHTACLGRHNVVQGGLSVSNANGAPVETRVYFEHTVFSTGDPIACGTPDTNLYLWGSTFNQSDLITGNPGGIDRDSHRFSQVTIPASPAPPQVLQIDPPFTNGGAWYTCVINQVQPTPAGGPIIGAKVNNSVTVIPDPTIEIHCDLTILAQRL